MIKRKYMRTRQLKPGMVIDQVIKDSTGRNLVVQGSTIDDYIIEALLKLGIMSVYIRDGNFDPNDPDAILSPRAAAKVKELRTDDRSKVTLNDSVRKQVSEGVQFIFNNTDSEEFTMATNQIADSLMNAINSNDAMAVDINAIKTSDEYTFKHSVDVATIAMILAKQLQLPTNEIHDIGVSGLLHDIGKTNLAIADVYDALVTKRSYKDAYSQRDAVELLMSMTGQLDITVMRAFMSSMILYPVDSIVQLSNGERARVVKNNEHYILRPTVVGVDSGRVYNLGDDLKCANIIIL